MTKKSKHEIEREIEDLRPENREGGHTAIATVHSPEPEDDIIVIGEPTVDGAIPLKEYERRFGQFDPSP